MFDAAWTGVVVEIGGGAIVIDRIGALTAKPALRSASPATR
ncbi:UNVERIFIED_ORG: hypothetical protein GGR78_003021 [Xanthomonas campestris]